MQLKVQKPERDLEVELKEWEAYGLDMTQDILPKDFWTDSQWNWIVQERGRIRAKVKGIKRELSMA